MHGLAQLETGRLHLLALEMTHLRLLLGARERFEEEVGLPVSPGLLDDNVRRAVTIKLGKMEALPPERQTWATYWLLVVKDGPRGIGLAGFKGAPNDAGEVEIGYGVDPDHRRRGYAREAVTALLGWAFSQPTCRVVAARNVRRDNLASQRLLAGLEMRRIRVGDETLDYAITSTDFKRG